MRVHGSAARLLCLALGGALASGCTTVRVIAPGPTGLHESIRPGDRLRVTMLDGRKFEMDVATVSREALAGTAMDPSTAQRRPLTVPFAGIARLGRVEVSVFKSAGTAVAAALVVLGSLMVMVLLNGLNEASRAHPATPPGAAP